MTKYLRTMSLAATAAFALAGAQASAAPVGAATPATGRAEIVKGLTLTAQSNLDLGKIVVWGNGTITLDTAGGIVCTTGALTCDATGSPATYRVTGSNNQTVTITKPNVTLNHETDATAPALTLTLTGQDTVLLPNSGSTGTTFSLGGQMNIPETVKDGVYSGNLNVTVQY
jgi:hypothetical protein